MKIIKRAFAGILLCSVVLVSIPLISEAKKQQVELDTENYEAAIKEKEVQIAKAQQDKESLQTNLTDAKKLKKKLEENRDDLQKYVTQLDYDMADVEKKLSKLEALIINLEAQMVQNDQELEEAAQREKEQYEALKKRIRFMYEKRESLYYDLVFGVEDFGDFLNKADYMEQVSAYDRKMLDSYVAHRKYIEICRDELEAERDLQKAAKEAAEEERTNLESLIGAKEQQIINYDSDIVNKDKAIKEYEADIEAQNTLIRQLEAAVAAAREGNGDFLTYDGGMFKWPAPSYTRVSDDYGDRIHPTLKVPQFHNGVDLAAPSGSKILAAYDGVIVAADYTSVMGNYIMIDHGNDLFTIYMHASALYVSKGDTVVKGQHIAAIGSTGRSTGPHLHFSVRLNGSYVSPWNYLSK